MCYANIVNLYLTPNRILVLLMGRDPGDRNLKIKIMIQVTQNRRERRNKKPFSYRTNGFRTNSRTLNLLKRFDEECIVDGSNQGEWIMKNIKSSLDVIGWSPEFRSICLKLLNQKELINFLELELNEEQTKKNGFKSYNPKNDCPSQLYNFSHLFNQGLQGELGLSQPIFHPHPSSLGSHTQVCSLTPHNTFFVRKYGNYFDIKCDEISFVISNLKDGIEIHNIEVKETGKGLGTKFLELVKKISDVTNIPIYLFPVDFKGIWRDKNKTLKNWYSKNGFTEVEKLGVHKYTPKVGGKVIELQPVPNEVLEKFQMVG